MSRAPLKIGLVVFFLLAISAYATDSSGVDENINHKLMTYWDEIDEYIHPDFENCLLAAAPPKAPVKTDPPVSTIKGSPECVSHYERLFSKPDIHITMAFGYEDERPDPLVNTPYDKADFVQRLTAPCSSHSTGTDKYKTFCGFTRDDDDASWFYKQIPGPNGEEHRVKVHVVSAVNASPSMSQYDRELRHSADQLKQSAEARKEYMAAFQQDDIVLYEGHSRNGGGPDFFPPALTAENKVDYAQYLRLHPGVNDLKTALSSGHHPLVIGLLSCDSKLHFEKQLIQMAPDSALLLTNMISDSDDEPKTIGAFLDGILSMRCDDDFVNSMESMRPLDPTRPKSGKAPVDDFEGWGVKTPNVTPAPARNSH